MNVFDVTEDEGGRLLARVGMNDVYSLEELFTSDVMLTPPRTARIDVACPTSHSILNALSLTRGALT